MVLEMEQPLRAMLLNCYDKLLSFITCISKRLGASFEQTELWSGIYDSILVCFIRIATVFTQERSYRGCVGCCTPYNKLVGKSEVHQ